MSNVEPDEEYDDDVGEEDVEPDVEEGEEEAEEEGDEDAEYDPDAEYTAEDIAKIIAENQRLGRDIKKVRDRYGPYERVFSGLNDDDAAAIAGFARTIAGGDRVSAVTWLAENAVGMAGDDDGLVEQLKAAGFTPKEIKEGVKQADTEGAADAKGPDVAELVKKMVGEQLAEERAAREAEAAEQKTIDAFVGELDQAIIGLGFEPGTAKAAALIQEATRMKRAGEAPDDIGKMMKAAHRNLIKFSRELVAEEADRRRSNGNGRPGPDGPAPSQAQTGGTEREQSERRIRNVENKLAGGYR